jgi:hypothetical protein
MLLPGSNPSSTGTTASSEAGDPIRTRRSAGVPASGATPAFLPVGDCARRSPRRSADGLRRCFPFRPGALRGAGFVAVDVVVAGVSVAGISVAGVSMSGVLVAGAVVVGVPAGIPGTGCGEEVPAERSCVIEPSVRGVNAAGGIDLLAVDNSGEIHNAIKVFLDEK